MATETKVRPINRLQSMYALRAYQDKMYDKGREAKEAGRPIAWGMVGIPTPILSAMGIETIFNENFAPICASSGAAAGFLARADAEGFPTHMCGYCRNGIGYTARMTDLDGQVPPETPGAGMPKPTLLVTGDATCDSHFKFMQALGRYLNVPLYVVDHPPTYGLRESLMEGAHERHIQFLVKEYKELVAFLENLTGRKMDWDKIGETKGNKELDWVWWETNELRKARPCPMHARDFWSAMAGVFYKAGDAKEITHLYHDMYNEVKDRVDNKVSGINYPERYRVTEMGLPPWHSLGFFDKLAERGWNFVYNQYHPGKPFDVDVSHISDPMERYVRANSRSLADTIDRDFEPEEAADIKDEIRRTGFSWRMGINYIRERQCDGAFLHPILTCRALTAPLFLYQKQLMKIYKVPSLVIYGDIVDLTLFDPEDALKKAEAFEETMDYYREVRRKEGLEW